MVKLHAGMEQRQSHCEGTQIRCFCTAGAMGGVYRVEMVPKKAMDQPASMDGHARECPVCTKRPIPC